MYQDIIIYRQVLPQHCQRLARLGYRSMINVRPDAEEATQPNSCEIATAAKLAKLAYHHLPYDGDQSLSDDTLRQFASLYAQLPKPVLVFCATGFRAKRLYQTALMKGLLVPS